MNVSEQRDLYLAAQAVLLGLVVGLLLGAVPGAYGQSQSASGREGQSIQWQLVLDGERSDWPSAVPTTALDSVRHVGQAMVDRWRSEGFYYARLDSAVVDTTGARALVRLYAHRGTQVTVGRLRIVGAEAVPVEELKRLMDTEAGDALVPRRLEADVQALLDHYEKAGHPLAQIRVAKTTIDSAAPPQLHVTLRMDEGPALWLKRIEVPDGARVSPGLVARLAGLNEGAPLTDYDPKAIQAALQESPLFDSVERPQLRVTGEGGAILRVPVEEAPPGSFDLVLGYLPSSGVRDDGQLVGSGHLLLENLFGGGRRMSLTLDRRPGQTSIFNLSISDPYIFGLPLRLTAQFEGEQRDSTYGERSYGLEGGYQFGNGFELTGSLSREVVKPGQAGARLREGQQRIPRSQTLFYGLGVRYAGVDRRVNPRRGVRLRVQAEQGRKDRTRRRIVASGDTVRADQAVRQERLRARVRGFVPLFDRHVLALGSDISVLRSRVYDRSDLFRLGGAQSLRGYDEDRFRGNVAVRGLLEYRLQLDRRSYAYAFGDLGYVARPALGRAPATQEWHPGYGIGIQLQTAIGRIRTTYALNPEVATPINGRIHFGLSVGL